jgi:hypothetical protein
MPDGFLAVFSQQPDVIQFHHGMYSFFQTSLFHLGTLDLIDIDRDQNDDALHDQLPVIVHCSRFMPLLMTP